MTPGDPEDPADRDRWLRDALDDAVADVEPRRDLDDIRARIEEDAMSSRTRQRWGAAAAGLAVAATVAAVALATGLDTGPDTDEAAGPASSPSATATAEQTDPTEPTESTESTGPTEPTEPTEPTDPAEPSVEGPVPVYYVGDTPTGPRLFREFRAPQGDGDALAVAVGMAVGVDPLDPDYRTPWPEGTTATADRLLEPDKVLQVDLSAGGRDLRSRPDGLSREEAYMALQQLVHTAQAAVQERAEIVFVVDGQPVDQLLGEPVGGPVAEGDPMEVQAPVWVITPQHADEVSGTLEVEGRGAFFEANVSWQVLRDGQVVRDGFATAQECCTLSPFSFEVPDLPPGDYVLRVYDADMSGGEGPGEHEDTKRFTITG